MAGLDGACGPDVRRRRHLARPVRRPGRHLQRFSTDTAPGFGGNSPYCWGWPKPTCPGTPSDCPSPTWPASWPPRPASSARSPWTSCCWPRRPSVKPVKGNPKVPTIDRGVGRVRCRTNTIRSPPSRPGRAPCGPRPWPRPCSRRWPRNTSAPPVAWHSEWETLADLLRLTGSSAAWLTESLQNLQINPDRMHQNRQAMTGSSAASNRTHRSCTARKDPTMTSVAVHFTVDGPTSADADAPTVVLAGSLGSTLSMWDPQIQALAPHYRVVRYDTRGHGKSPDPETSCSIDDLADDLLALIDRLGTRNVHLVGLSLGGMAAMRLAARKPDRVRSLALLCTSALLGPAQDWLTRAARVREQGTAAVADAVVAQMVQSWLPRRPAGPSRPLPQHDRRDPGAWLRRLLRGHRRDGPAAGPAEHHRTDPGHRRNPGPGDSATPPTSHRRGHRGIDSAHGRTRRPPGQRRTEPWPSIPPCSNTSSASRTKGPEPTDE